MEWVMANLPQILLIAAMALSALRPWLIAQGVPAEIIDQILEILGGGSIAAMRTALPVPSQKKTYVAVATGITANVAGIFGLLPPLTALTIGAVMLGAAGLGFGHAMKRLSEKRAAL